MMPKANNFNDYVVVYSLLPVGSFEMIIEYL